jgi:hypothetical protein
MPKYTKEEALEHRQQEIELVKLVLAKKDAINKRYYEKVEKKIAILDNIAEELQIRNGGRLVLNLVGQLANTKPPFFLRFVKLHFINLFQFCLYCTVLFYLYRSCEELHHLVEELKKTVMAEPLNNTDKKNMKRRASGLPGI